MSNRLFCYLRHELSICNLQQIRKNHTMFDKPSKYTKTLQQRLEEMNERNPELDFKVDIGFKLPKFSRQDRSEEYTKFMMSTRSNPELEKKARKRELLIDLEEMAKDWSTTNAPKQIKIIADHYEVYDHLFGDAYFHPVVPLRIEYDFGNEDKVATVHRGNLLTPSETAKPPTVTYDAEPDTLWTLLLTTPDGNFSDEKLEYCHWFIGNIPGNDVEKGDVLVDYMRPIPSYGIGYCRYIFVLYKQNQRINFDEYKLSQPCFELEKRNWSTLDFYRKFQDMITPGGLSFYQASWDKSLREFYQHTLGMKMPHFEYDFPAPYIRKQEWFPKGRPFNLYMDKYRDPKQINKEFLMRKMKTIHPFKESPSPLKYPNAQILPRELPSWLKLEMTKERQGWGRINEID